MSREDYDQLNRYSTTLQLTLGTLTLYNLSIVRARCVSRGLVADANAMYLVELTDGRGVVYNDSFRFPITKAYNTRAPAYPQTYYYDSMNVGVAWTWTTMLQNIWGLMTTFLGAWPGLPFVPTGTPEGFWFTGVPAWTALCDVLEHLGMKVACDLTQASPFTIVQCGATDSAFDTLTTTHVPDLEEDLEWLDFGAARMPGTVVVLFRRRNSVYGAEETVTYLNDSTAKQWASTPYYSVSVSAPSDFASAVGTHYIWSDFTVRYDSDGTPIAADTTTAAAIAAERVTQYYDRVGQSALTRTYAGALPFATGSQVDWVYWDQSYLSRGWHGWRTRIGRGPDPVSS